MKKLMFHYGFKFSLLILFYLAGCQIKQPIQYNETHPSVSDLTISDTLYTQTAKRVGLSVMVTDPQGIETVEDVFVLIYGPDNPAALVMSSLADAGEGVDILPGDGVFSTDIAISLFSGMTGHFQAAVFAKDQDGNRSDTLFTSFYVADRERNLPPRLSLPVFPETITMETIHHVSFSVHVSDPQGDNDIDSVRFKIYPPLQPVSSYSGEMLNNGKSCDVTDSDDIYSFCGDLDHVLKISDVYQIRMEATDKGGLTSLPLVISILIKRDNDAPVLYSLSVPDTVSRYAAKTHVISIRVSDKQGAADISSVYFNSYKPDGSASSGNPFHLFDSGDEMSHGDDIRGDGIYSRIIQINSSNALGNYRFEFFAVDLSGAVSDPLIYSITVID